MLRVSPSLLCMYVLGKSRHFSNLLAAAQAKYVLLTGGSAEYAAQCRKFGAKNPTGKLVMWATNHALSIILPSAVVTLDKFTHVEVTRPSKDVKWPFTLAAGGGSAALPEEAVLRFTEEPEYDFAEYYDGYELNKNGLRIRTKETEYINGKSLDDALTVRFAMATPLPIPFKSSTLWRFCKNEGELLKSNYALIDKIGLRRTISARLRTTVVQVEWTPRGPDDIKKFVDINEGSGELKLFGLSPVRRLYLSSLSQTQVNALDLLKIRVSGTETSFGGQTVEVYSDGSRWVVASAQTLAAAVATKQPITLIASCAFRTAGPAAPEVVVAGVKAGLVKRHKDAVLARKAMRAEKSAVRNAKRQERHKALIARRAERRKRRSEERKAWKAQRRADKVAKRAAQRKLRAQKRRLRLAKRALRRKEQQKQRAEKRRLLLAMRAKQRKSNKAIRKLRPAAVKAASVAALAAEPAEAQAALKQLPSKKAATGVALSARNGAPKAVTAGKKAKAVSMPPQTSSKKVATPAASERPRGTKSVPKRVKPVASLAVDAAAAPSATPAAAQPADATPVTIATVDL